MSKTDNLSELTKLSTSLYSAQSDLISELIQLRKNLKITKKEMAERIGISKAEVEEFEHYDSDPKFSTLIGYAVAVRANISYKVTPFVN